MNDDDGVDHDITEAMESAYQMANRKTVEETSTLQKIIDKMGGNSSDVSDWMDDYGCCKICGGEIPGGHQTKCVIYTQETKIKEAEAALNSMITDCAILEVDKEILEARIEKLEKELGRGK